MPTKAKAAKRCGAALELVQRLQALMLSIAENVDCALDDKDCSSEKYLAASWCARDCDRLLGLLIRLLSKLRGKCKAAALSADVTRHAKRGLRFCEGLRLLIAVVEDATFRLDEQAESIIETDWLAQRAVQQVGRELDKLTRTVAVLATLVAALPADETAPAGSHRNAVPVEV